MARATKNIIFRFVSSSVLSFNGGGCCIPISASMIKAKNNHPVSIMMKTAIHPAYFCLSPKTALKICPPSNWPAGSKLMEVIRRPIHSANAIGLRSRAAFDGRSKSICDIIEKRSDDPRPISPVATDSMVIISDVAIPMMDTGTATRNPAIGPEIPTSNNAFLSGMGS